MMSMEFLGYGVPIFPGNLFSHLKIAAISSIMAGSALLSGCAGLDPHAVPKSALAQIAQEPVNSAPWEYAGRPGAELSTDHYRLYTTLDSSLDRRLILRVLEGAFEHFQVQHAGHAPRVPMTCFVFGNRWEWERFTRERAGTNAPIYLQITAGGYCQSGMFAGYDIGREQMLSVIGHEAWHQYSWFAFQDRLPSWLEEGLATQNEAIAWQGAQPQFDPALNYRRYNALREARSAGYFWQISDLLQTHAGRVISEPQRRINAYYAQLWALVLFLQHSQYKPGLDKLLADAEAGRLVDQLKGKGVTKLEVALFTERWNRIAGPAYFEHYIGTDMGRIQAEYEAYVDRLISAWPGRPDE